MLEIPQASLQEYLNHELPDVQVGFRKCRGTRDQIANTCWIIKKAREFQKIIYFCLTVSKSLTLWKWKPLSHVNILWPHRHSMEFSRPEYWSGQPFPSPGNLPHPGIEPRSPALQADSLPTELWITTNWKILQEMGVPDLNYTCLWRNLYAGQEATVRTGHGTTDWFQIGERSTLSLLSLYWVNLYAECIMQNARLDEAKSQMKLSNWIVLNWVPFFE